MTFSPLQIPLAAAVLVYVVYVVKSMLCSAKYFHSEKSMQNGLIERSFGKHVTKYVREWQRRQQRGRIELWAAARQGLQFSAQTSGMPAKTSQRKPE